MESDKVDLTNESDTIYTDIFMDENIFAEFAGEVYPRN